MGSDGHIGVLALDGNSRRRARSRAAVCCLRTAPNRAPSSPAASIRNTACPPARAWSNPASRCRRAAASIASASPIRSPAAPTRRKRTAAIARKVSPPGTATTSTAGSPPMAKSTTWTRSRPRIRRCRCRAMCASPISRRSKSLVVRVNDRGPYHANREIDLSAKAADLLGFRNHGTAKVRVEYVGRRRSRAPTTAS